VLAAALVAGHRVLADGGSAVDAVVTAVTVMEDDPLYNAGKGAAFTADGTHELDAAVMCGRSGQAGAVAGVKTVRNPIVAARAVMEKTRHVLLVGEGAERFAVDQGLVPVDPSYFHTDHRWDQLQKARIAQRVLLDHDGAPRAEPAAVEPVEPWKADDKFGTVGAVALDRHGHLAAGTSTGGLTNKLYGRVGDSPIIGAGTWAEDATCALSGTGTGEYFMRGVLAHEVAARMRHAGATLAEAARQSVQAVLTERGGRGGLIGLDARGEVVMAFNTEGMYRGVVRADGVPQTAVFGV
jgi:L-asparaginase / beta-aspartyl-peptidase